MKAPNYIGRLLGIFLLMHLYSLTFAQSKLVAYSTVSGSYATNGQTQLWSSVGGMGANDASSGTTTLSAGTFGQGFHEVILGIIDDLEGELVLVQNRNSQIVLVKNSSNRRIISARIINAEGRQMNAVNTRENYDGSELSFSTYSFKPGVYLLQLNLQGLPVTKKFLVQ